MKKIEHMETFQTKRTTAKRLQSSDFDLLHLIHTNPQVMATLRPLSRNTFMTDNEFLVKFTQTTLDKSEFNHRGHIRIAWIHLMRHDFATASHYITEGIKKFAASLGAAQIYHETLTCTWIQLVADAIASRPQADNFNTFIQQAPELLDKNAPLQLYSKPLLESETAKVQWLTPDVVSSKRS